MRMVDVSGKAATARIAVARAELRCSAESLAVVREGRAKKGDVLAAARLAGVMAAKRTPDLVPLCHPIALSGVEMSVEPDEARGCFAIEARVKTVERTGVEMEALTACAAAALTIYDMLKSGDRGMEIASVRLVRKSGGRSGDWRRAGERKR